MGGTQTKRRRSSGSTGAEAALGDEGTPIPFDECTLVPRWSRLRFSDFEPFLHLDRFVEPAWSDSYLQYQLEFFHACAPRELWANEPGRHTRKPDLPTLASEIVRFQPDKDALATAIPPLHPAPNRPSLSDKAMRKLQGMAHVLAWVLDLSDVSVDEVFGFAQTAPPAVYALIREFAPVSNCKTLVWHASTELHLHLTNLRHPTPHESAALTLLIWLAQSSLERPVDRSHLFFAFPDGSRRIGRSGEKPWEWWFARAGRGASCDAARLDAWEKETLEREEWPV